MPVRLRARLPNDEVREYVIEDDRLGQATSARGDGATAIQAVVRLIEATLRSDDLGPASQRDYESILNIASAWCSGTASDPPTLTIEAVRLDGAGGPRGPRPGQESKRAASGAPTTDEAVLEALTSEDEPLLLVYDDHVAARERLRDHCQRRERQLYLWTRADGWNPLIPDSSDGTRMLTQRSPVVAVGEALQAVQNSKLPQRVAVAFQDLAAELTGDQQVLATALPSLARALREIGGLLILLGPTPVVPPSWTPFRVRRFRTGRSATPLLDRFGHDLTAAARRGDLDPIEGRRKELQAIKVALLTPPGASSSPLLLGAKGTGKSAILEQLAIELKDDPDERLNRLRVVSISMASLIAGTALRGTLEERVEQLLEEAEESRDSVVLVLDEIHTIASSPPALEALKEPLARGRIHVVGATTPEDWSHVERQHEAFASRFRPIRLEESDRDKTVAAMRNRRDKVLARAFGERVAISDKVIGEIAEACARYLPQDPAPRRPIQVMFELATKANATGTRIDASAIADLLSEMTGAQLGDLSDDERRSLANLSDKLRKAIYGQDEAVSIVADAVAAHRLQFNGGRPTVLLLVGPTGTGKTETAKQINKALMRDLDLITFNMETYGQPHSGQSLLGAPASYVGYEEGSLLVNLARKHPYRVVLLDEFEKADPDTIIQLMNVLYDGRYTDPRGLFGDFRRWFFCLTTNIVQEDEFLGKSNEELTTEVVARFAKPRPDGRAVPIEVISRVSRVVPFRSLDLEALSMIVRDRLRDLKKQVQSALGADIMVQWDEQVVEHVAKTARQSGRGARALDQELNAVRFRAPADFLRRERKPTCLVITVKDGILRHEWI